jgi:hypothetical protein
MKIAMIGSRGLGSSYGGIERPLTDLCPPSRMNFKAISIGDTATRTIRGFARSLAERLAAATNYHGVAHFDVRRDAATGDLTLIECNPRYWYSMFACCLAGLNFVDLSRKTGSLDPMDPLVRRQRL